MSGEGMEASSSTAEGQVKDQAISVLTTTIYTVMGLLGVLGNTLVLVVIIVVRDLHDVANVLIGNQSLIDLLTSLLLLASFVAPLPSIPTNNPILARFLCAFWHSKYPFWSLIVASSLNLTLMTLERYYAIVFPLHYHSRTKSTKLACLVALPWLSGFAYQQNLMWFSQTDNDSCNLFQFPNDEARTGFAFGAMFLELVLPIAVMAFVYTSLTRKLRSTMEEKFHKRTKENPRSTSESKTRKAGRVDHRRTARRNIIKVMLTVSLFFIICWTPNQVLYTAFCFGYNLDFNGFLYTFSVFIAFGNMWINPFIYSFQYRRFQKGLKKVFCKKRRSNRPMAVSNTLSATL
nr:galanin receptor 2b-like [Lytechinus pictus]